MISSLPFGGSKSAGTYRIVGRALPATATPPHALNDRVAGDYFRAMGIPLLEGRTFADGDRVDATRVVIVDRFLAEKQFPGVSPLGQQLNFGSPRNYTIVGVVGTVNASDLAKPVPEERIYFSAAQVTPMSMTLTLKTAVDAASLASAGAQRGPGAGSGAGDRADADDGRLAVAVAAAAPRADDADRRVRRRGAGDVVDRDLRRPCLRRRAARPRVRHPPGARRRPRVDPVARAGDRGSGPPPSASSSAWPAPWR